MVDVGQQLIELRNYGEYRTHHQTAVILADSGQKWAKETDPPYSIVKLQVTVNPHEVHNRAE